MVEVLEDVTNRYWPSTDHCIEEMISWWPNCHERTRFNLFEVLSKREGGFEPAMQVKKVEEGEKRIESGFEWTKASVKSISNDDDVGIATQNGWVNFFFLTPTSTTCPVLSSLILFAPCRWTFYEMRRQEHQSLLYVNSQHRQSRQDRLARRQMVSTFK